MVCMWRSRIKKHKNLQTASPCRSRLSHIWAIRGHFWWQMLSSYNQSQTGAYAGLTVCISMQRLAGDASGRGYNT